MKDISLHVMDIVQNSIAAGAKNIGILLAIDEMGNRMTLRITDDGKGMDAELVQRVISPFTTSRTTRKVGLGIPLFMESAQRTGGDFHIRSEVGVGTEVTATYVLNHIDRPPLGDMAGTVYMLIVTNVNLDFSYTVENGDRAYTLDTKEVKQVLDGVPLTDPDVGVWLKESLLEGDKETRGGVME
ncbi:ATP-binding protein [Eubacteriales bacterium OttesenSCG-928-M02]|nr:ATP-binding protein [Eubacteriales bacterium OttesenSCG-928-M02]